MGKSMGWFSFTALGSIPDSCYLGYPTIDKAHLNTVIFLPGYWDVQYNSLTLLVKLPNSVRGTKIVYTVLWFLLNALSTGTQSCHFNDSYLPFVSRYKWMRPCNGPGVWFIAWVIYVFLILNHVTHKWYFSQNSFVNMRLHFIFT